VNREQSGAYVLPCRGVTYVSSGLSGDDGPWEQIAECDDIGGCGWRVVMQEYTGTFAPEGLWDVTVTSTEFLPLHEAHLTHRHRNDPDPHPEDCLGCVSWEAPVHVYRPTANGRGAS
jgi:hypothetical protein